uniref:Uncharacterized protein n=1 Tax=Anguilla anguilla TaxID=7936 RepID=A0A0E9UWR9_ANGAN
MHDILHYAAFLSLTVQYIMLN